MSHAMACQWSMLTLSNTWVCTFTHVVTFLTSCCHGIAHVVFEGQEAAWSWDVVQQRHAQLQCSNTVNLMLSLLQCILIPALRYG